MKGRALAWPLLALLLAALAFQTGRLRGRLLASQLTHQVEEVSMVAAASGPGAVERLLPFGLTALRRAGAADPVAVEVPLSRGSLYLLARRPQDAIEAYRAAAALEPHPEIYLHLGDALLAAGQFEEARRSYRTALLLDPWLRSAVPAGLN
ncbi:MAG TPA: tetratricopeptide repeat protein [Thermoanaerobaculia bacterium]|nr:tetratricopeptide repeat protein [Thermoanaerobaculia bacterium]